MMVRFKSIKKEFKYIQFILDLKKLIIHIGDFNL